MSRRRDSDADAPGRRGLTGRGPRSLYRVVFQQAGGASREGVVETSLPCLVDHVVAGVLRDEASGEIIFPFSGRIVERSTAEPPYSALLVIEPHGLELGHLFDPVDSRPS